MKERVPDSTGLPLRAMVMVLLFLGVIFLLLGWQALGSSGSSDEDSASPVSSVTSATSASPTSTSAKPQANQAEVRVYNISSKEGVAAHTKDRANRGFDRRLVSADDNYRGGAVCRDVGTRGVLD